MYLSCLGYSVISLCLFYAIYTDIKFRKIFNKIPLTIIFVSVLLILFTELKISYISVVVIFISGFLLSVYNFWGAGDAKFCFALSLSLPGEYIPTFLLFTSLAGGILAVIMLAIPRLKGKYKSVPYGIALSLGYMATMLVL